MHNPNRLQALRPACLRQLLAAVCLLLVAAGFAQAQAQTHAHDPAHNTAANISASNAWVRATPPGAVTGAAFLTLRNNSDLPAQLSGVQCAASVAARCEIHQHIHTADGRMRMQKIEGLTIPPRSELRFSPGSYHVMLLALAQPLTKTTDTAQPTDVELVFTFVDQSTYHAHLPVKPVNEE
jgi:copper(I)-binding protein